MDKKEIILTEGRYYKLKKSNDNVLGLLLIIAFIGTFYLWVNHAYFRLGHFPFGFKLLGGFLLGIALWTSRLVRYNHRLEISNGLLTVAGGLLKRTKSIRCADIAMVKYHRARPFSLSTRRADGNERIEIITSRGRYFFKCSSVSQQQEMRRFLNDLVSEIHAEAQYSKDWKYDYINPLFQNKNVVIRNTGNKRQKRSAKWALLAFVLFLLLIVPKYMDFLNSFVFERRYIIEEDGVYFWKTKIEEADAKTFVILDLFTVAKDSAHVFYCGEIVENADVQTFKEVGWHLFIDKNHLYGPNPRLFPPSKELWIMDEVVNVDIPTFEAVGEMFKDKNNLYVRLLNYPYIEQIEMPVDFDLASFKYQARGHEYIENNRVYSLDGDGNLILKRIIDSNE